MIRNTILSLAALSALASTVTAQQYCTDNQYRLHLTDADGNPAPTFVDPVTNETTVEERVDPVTTATGKIGSADPTTHRSRLRRVDGNELPGIAFSKYFSDTISVIFRRGIAQHGLALVNESERHVRNRQSDVVHHGRDTGQFRPIALEETTAGGNVRE